MGVVESSGLLTAPECPANIPENVQWLGGVGAGSWFSLHHDATMDKYQYRIQRFAPDGNIECDRMFFLDDDFIDVSKPYQFAYLSHCEMCTILQDGQKYTLRAI